MKHYDAIIIGFGKGGKTLALDLAQSGQKVAMIERSAAMYGGTCINTACIPTKALIHQAKISEYRKLKTFEEKAQAYQKAIAEKNEVTAFLRKKNFDKLNEHPNVDVYTGTGAFLSPTEVEVTTETERFVLNGDRFFINTGAETVIPPIAGIRESQRVYTSSSIMELDRPPEQLVIIGGGYIGLEFASMYAEFGSKVVVLESYPQLIGKEDKEIAEATQKVLESKGIEFRLNASVQEIQDTDETTIVTYKDAASQTIHNLFADAVLVATGRKPNTEGLNPGAAGIKTDERGTILVNEFLQTNVPHIWAIGDVKGGLQFTYISLDDYRIIRDQLFGKGTRKTTDRNPVVYAVFIDPPLSRIGMTEKEAVEKGYEIKTRTIPVATIPRARVLGGTDGLLKSVVDARTGKILGCTMFCVDSSEAINIVSLAIKAGLDYTALRDQIYTHPSMSESLNDLFTF